MVQPTSPLKIIVLMPLRDDWASAAELIRRLDQTLAAYPCILDVLIVDDGSQQACNPADFHSQFNVVRTIRILRLRRNLGHQRAIAIGLVHVEQSLACDAVLVMDADGEDTADGALQLIHAYSETQPGTQAIFAERSRRTESLIFRFCYLLYKGLHRLLTGIGVRVGNFSILPSSQLSTLVVMSELWNHYAAAVFRSSLPFTMIPIPRGHRITGTSKMNFISLAAHGMSAISVFGDVVGVRLLAGSIAALLVPIVSIVGVALFRLFTGHPVPGWTFYIIGAIAIVLIPFITIATSFTFTLLSTRMHFSFVPLRDCALFVAGTQDIYPNE